MKSKIKERKFDKSDSKGSSCLLVFEDGVDGYFNWQGEFPFSLGEEVEYTAIQSPNKSKPGKFYNKLTITKMQQASAQNTPPPPPFITPPPTPINKPVSSFVLANAQAIKAEASIKAMEYMIDCFIADKVQWDQIQPRFKELTGYLNDAVDECYS